MIRYIWAIHLSIAVHWSGYPRHPNQIGQLWEALGSDNRPRQHDEVVLGAAMRCISSPRFELLHNSKQQQIHAKN